ncbi:hypothetical protein FCH79_17030 [Pseudomonas koreensis]|nr:hypothetical protein [Pseudomonas koreensis]
MSTGNPSRSRLSTAGALVECEAIEGCDDVLVGVGQPGRLMFGFVGEARFAHGVIESIMEDVCRAEPNACSIDAALVP